MIKYQSFPRSMGIDEMIAKVIDCFEKNDSRINSKDFKMKSDDVLKILEPDLKKIGFNVEENKTAEGKIKVPVLYSLNNNIDKCFDADAVSIDGQYVLEVEGGQGFVNNKFLKDIFQACMMYTVKCLIVAVRNDYRGHDDFSSIFQFLETLFINGRLKLPLERIVLIGY